MSDATHNSERPEKKAPSKRVLGRTLASLVSRHLKAVQGEWTFGECAAEEAQESSLAKLPFPAVAVVLGLDGECQGRMLFAMPLAEAAALTGQGVQDPEAFQAEALTPFAQALATAAPQAYRRAGEVTAVVVSCQALKAPEELPATGVPADGWVLRASISFQGRKAADFCALLGAEPWTALASAHRESQSGGATPAKRGLVLVVDDQHAIRTLLKRHLEKEGFAVVEATNGEEALRALAKKEKPSLVIMDVMMPGLDGLEACRRLRQLEGCKGIPVIMCTGKGQRRDVADALQAGANDYIVKPFTREILLAKVAKALAPPAFPS